MPSFIDVSCPKCGRKHGWFGEMPSRPPCPRCGHLPPYDPADDLAFKEMEELLRKKMLGENPVDAPRTGGLSEIMAKQFKKNS